ncbi:UDP-N-acetylmuramoyl-L-alanine--D-glutamate ligase [Nocardioides pantholopis]|uniref:UDP-N-acetylmuramoyl-L-alanine--D-glutamate ligase n=1 Tax=Nocardioides pantholopis TaxID=2483798 RepID=UPI000FD9BBDC|nr:UDP-N-acetylmuramoyl-L-alanine--D-glutamate ligase [Nocardioides pantholopis]
MRFSDLPDHGVVVWGYGREGSAAAGELARRGLDAVVALPEADPSQAPVEAPLPVLVGDDALAALRAASAVVKSPGIPATSPLYVELAAAGVALTSLTDLWLSEHAARTIAVTGTKGKSTTASLVAHLCVAAGLRSAVVGNVGAAALSVDADALDVVALEVSSYQAQSLTVSPRVAVVTSLFAEHLPWHGSFEQYAADKLRLVAHGPEHVVLPRADPALRERVQAVLDGRTTVHLTDPEHVHVSAAGDLVWPGVGTVSRAELPLAGRHNAENIALALLAVDVAGLLADDDQRARALAAVRTFAPLDHRLQPVPSADGRHWVDDSLATAPEAVVAALEVWAEEPVALLFGGSDRGLDLGPLLAYLAERKAPVTVFACGAAGARLAAGFPSGTPHTVLAHPTFADAVRAALAAAEPAGTVLFSPGAPSFDEYADYRDRAAALRALLR